MRVQNITDQQLVSAFLSGDSLSIERLIIRHKDKVFGYILSKVKDIDVANDIFQEVFIKVINKLNEGRYNEEGKFIAWVMRISHNMVIDHFRKNARVRMVRLNSYKSKDLKILISHLSEEQRSVLEMRYYADMTFKEIAEECGISINTALGRMRYALMNLRKLKEKHQVNLAVQ